MTIVHLLDNFRHALLGVFPSTQAVGIACQRSDAYDEWDAIASTLFNTLVVSVLRWSLPIEAEAGRLVLPDYDLLLEDYSSVSLLMVQHTSLPSGLHTFHCFGTENRPFDIVELVALSEDFKPNQNPKILCPFGPQIRISLLLRGGTGHAEIIDEIGVENWR